MSLRKSREKLMRTQLKRDEIMEIWDSLETKLGDHPEFAATFVCVDEETDGIYAIVCSFSRFLTLLLRNDSFDDILTCLDFINELVEREHSQIDGALRIDLFELLVLSRSQDAQFRSVLSPRALDLFQEKWFVRE